MSTMDRGGARPARPQSVDELIKQAENFNFNPNIPFKHWTRAADTLYQEAHFALADGDYGRAFLMLYRHSALVMKLVSHPQYRDPDSKKLFRPLSKRTNAVLDDMDRIKPIIVDEYAEWDRMVGSSVKGPQRPARYDDYAARDPSLTGRAKVLDASENQELAVDLAQQELARRDRARESRAPASAAADGRRAKEWYQGDDGDLRSQMEAARRALSPAGRDDKSDGVGVGVPAHYNYPSISRSQAVSYEPQPRVPPPPPPSQSPVPSRPPKEALQEHRPLLVSPAIPAIPAIPGKVPLDRPPSVATEPRPLGPPRPKKERIAFKPGAYLENGDPIRPIFVPNQLRRRFLEIAADNTRAGLEMCGILCGTPVNNALFVRCLLIPDQKCTSDTCETENEGTMFDYCASEDLLVLGWIHTHPTQTCFMSSRDLHTQAGYQVMMPESIAIVCAPRFQPSYGIFRLTHPPGLNHILDCNHQDTFHQHSIDNLYRETEHPDGHVYESDKLPFYVQDLRTK
ncbi:endosome-associated ubiquitin isopeptidase (AmsH) [Purpureocillium lavendulum]|uniref:Endosome-associated ubiquitin isopeptidase (AmsH) n=1 Tax=Purpureocillium lavendulum TaxID=1247861 RepID=A0AB34FQ63_9HYPO|nr:endosome-associated ubiquitin isopeptidase (AmsH) [Purpureocillium lavendulum]